MKEIARIEVNGINEWKEVALILQPTFNVSAIAIGPSCETSIVEKNFYYYIDNIRLIHEADQFILHEISVDISSSCDSLIFNVPYIEGIQYQWYLDGIALINEKRNSIRLPVSTNQVLLQLRLHNGVDCSIKDYFVSEMTVLPTANLGREEITICKDTIVELGIKNLGKEFLWSTGENTPTIEVQEAGYYSVTVYDGCGNSSSDQIVIYEDNSYCCEIEAPNAFTPNGDNVNDSFYFFSNCIFDVFNLTIFNRWGEVIYQTNSPIERWKGQHNSNVAPSDVYIWVLSYSFLSFSNQVRVQKGDITLIR